MMLRIRRTNTSDGASTGESAPSAGAGGVAVLDRGAAVNAYARSAGLTIIERATDQLPASPPSIATENDAPARSPLAFSELLRRFSAPAPAPVGPAPLSEVTTSTAAAVTTEDRSEASASGGTPDPAGNANGTGGSGRNAPAQQVERTRAALRAAERAYDVLRALSIGDDVAAAMLEEAVRDLPPPALEQSERLLDRAVGGLLRRLRPIALTPAALHGKRLAFAGPTGAGKTTALLKAAAHLRQEGAEVAVVGADVSRPGAREQLFACCMVLGLPLTAVDGPVDLARACSHESDDAIVLIDLPAGYPGESADQVSVVDGDADSSASGLDALLAAVPERFVIMTAPATASAAEIRRLTRAAASVRARAVALTKLDEIPSAPNAGLVGAQAAFNLVAHLRLPPLLCSTGRDVRADLQLPTATALAIAALEAAAAR